MVAPQRPSIVPRARRLGLVALAQERHLEAVDAVADQRQQAGQQERRVEHRGEHAERAAHAELGDERDADHGQAGDRDRDRHAGEDHRATRRRRRVGGGLARRHAVVERLSEARDYEERVVDADADADHRDEDRRDRVEVGQVREQEEQANAVRTETPANRIGTPAATTVRKTISSTISATRMPSSLAGALFRRRLIGVTRVLGLDAGLAERGVIESSSLTILLRESWNPSLENCTSA